MSMNSHTIAAYPTAVEGLRTLARWFDCRYGQKPGDTNRDVQEDLERWADEIAKLKNGREKVIAYVESGKRSHTIDGEIEGLVLFLCYAHYMKGTPNPETEGYSHWVLPPKSDNDECIICALAAAKKEVAALKDGQEKVREFLLNHCGEREWDNIRVGLGYLCDRPCYAEKILDHPENFRCCDNCSLPFDTSKDVCPECGHRQETLDDVADGPEVEQ